MNPTINPPAAIRQVRSLAAILAFTKERSRRCRASSTRAGNYRTVRYRRAMTRAPETRDFRRPPVRPRRQAGGARPRAPTAMADQHF